MLIIEPGYEEICEWISEWLAKTKVDASQRISA